VPVAGRYDRIDAADESWTRRAIVLCLLDAIGVSMGSLRKLKDSRDLLNDFSSVKITFNYHAARHCLVRKAAKGLVKKYNLNRNC